MPDLAACEGGASAEGAGTLGARRREIVRTLERLEEELAGAEAALLALGDEPLRMLHLAVEAAGRRALLPAGRVREVLRVVATQPVPGAPPEVLGTFVLRGTPVTVLDLARLLGVVREPSLDAHIVVLGGARAVGILVDRVLAVEDEARVASGGSTEETAPWSGGLLLGALCRWGDQVLPLLDPVSLVRHVEGT